MTTTEKIFRFSRGAITYPILRALAAIPRLIYLAEATLIRHPIQELIGSAADVKEGKPLTALWRLFKMPFESIYDICKSVGYEVGACLFSPIIGGLIAVDPNDSISKNLEGLQAKSREHLPNDDDWVLVAIDRSDPRERDSHLSRLLSPEKDRKPLHWSLRALYAAGAFFVYPVLRVAAAVPRIVTIWQSTLIDMFYTPLLSVAYIIQDDPRVLLEYLVLKVLPSFFVIHPALSIYHTALEIGDCLSSPFVGADKAWNLALDQQLIDDAMSQYKTPEPKEALDPFCMDDMVNIHLNSLSLALSKLAPEKPAPVTEDEEDDDATDDGYDSDSSLPPPDSDNDDDDEDDAYYSDADSLPPPDDELGDGNDDSRAPMDATAALLKILKREAAALQRNGGNAAVRRDGTASPPPTMTSEF